MKSIKDLQISHPDATAIPMFLKIIDDIRHGNNVFLVGSAGTGKTSLAETVAYSIQGMLPQKSASQPFITLNCNQWTSPIEIIGGQTIEGYTEGALSRAWTTGKLLILDELPKLDPNTAGLLNDALAKTGLEEAIIFNGRQEPLKKHPDFGCIATGNTLGKGSSTSYVGNNQQDTSLLDRFSSCVYFISFNEALERKLIYPHLVTICIEIRNALIAYTQDEQQEVMSLRTMIHMQRIYETEMKALVGLTDSHGTPYEALEGGKTIVDALESYLAVMPKDKATHIRNVVQLEHFYNTYKDATHRTEFTAAFQKRYPTLPNA